MYHTQGGIPALLSRSGPHLDCLVCRPWSSPTLLHGSHISGTAASPGWMLSCLIISSLLNEGTGPAQHPQPTYS